jgi:hypothetical protein
MSYQEEPLGSRRNLSELFSALKAVVAGSEHIQEMIRTQERDNRQVLLNMSSVLRMVERERQAEADGVPAERYEPKVVAGWMTEDGTVVEDSAERRAPAHEAEPAGDTGAPDDSDGADGEPMNFFDRAFLRSLKISS